MEVLLRQFSRWHGDVLRIEDAFLGLLANAAALQPTNLRKEFQDPPKGVPQGPSLFNGKMLVHRVAQASEAFPWILAEPTKRKLRAGANGAHSGAHSAPAHGGLRTRTNRKLGSAALNRSRTHAEKKQTAAAESLSD